VCCHHHKKSIEHGAAAADYGIPSGQQGARTSGVTIDTSARPRMAWMDNIKTWTGLPVEESIRMTEDRDKWRKYVHGVANPRIDDG